MANDAKIVRRAFNAGEVSKRFKWRNDVEKHQYSCEILENFYVDVLGAIERREGTRLLDVLGDSDYNVRLVPFEYNREFSRILALHEENSDFFDANFSVSTKSQHALTACFVVPEFPSGTSEKCVFRKGFFSIFYDASNERVRVQMGESNLRETAETGDKIAVVLNNGTLSLFINGTSKQQTTCEGFDDDQNLVFTFCKQSDLGPLKFFDFDISEEGAPFTLSNWTGGSASSSKYFGSPSVDPVSKYGSSLEDGNLTSENWSFYLSARRGEVQNIYSSALENGLENLLSQYDSAFEIVNASEGESGENPYSPEEISSAQQTISNVLPQIKSTLAGVYGFSDYDSFFEEYENDLPEVSNPLWSDFDKLRSLACSPQNFPFHWVDEVLNQSVSVWSNAYVSNLCDSKSDGIDIVFVDDDGIETPVVSNTFVQKKQCGVRIKFRITPESGTHSLSGYDLKWSGSELLSGTNPTTTRERVVKLSVYGTSGEKLHENLDTPIPPSALREFQFKQAGGDLYIVHSSISPKKLSINSGGAFSWTNAINIQPSKDEKEENLKITSQSDDDTGVFYRGDTAKISSSRDFFTFGMEGEQLKIDYADEVSHTYVWKYPSIGETTAVFPAAGEVRVSPQGGIWDGVLILEESTDNGVSWLEIGRTTSIQGSDNTEFIREVYDVSSVVRCKMLEQKEVADTSSTTVDDSTEGCFFNISRTGSTAAWIEIVEVYSPNSALVRFLNPARKNFESASVYRASWNSDFGWPRSVDVHEERLALGGTAAFPATVWLSQTNKWDNFRSVSNLDTDPLSYTLASDDGDPISWIVSREDLMIGTGSAEWSLGSRDSNSALTASIVKASRQSDDGTEYIQPTSVGDMLVFVRRGNRDLAYISYDFANDAYNALSLTTMNPEIMGDGFIEIFNQLSPSNKIYALRNDGIVAVFTYDKANNVAAWSRFLFGNGVVSSCALSTGNFKSVFLAVKRNGFLCLERLDPNENKTGNWLDCTPISDEIEIPEGLDTSVKYASILRTTPIFLEGNVRVLDLKMYLLNSFGGKFRVVGFNKNGDECSDDWRDILPRESEFLQPIQPRDYRYIGSCNTGYLEEGSIEISTSSPAPFELTAIGINAKG